MLGVVWEPVNDVSEGIIVGAGSLGAGGSAGGGVHGAVSVVVTGRMAEGVITAVLAGLVTGAPAVEAVALLLPSSVYIINIIIKTWSYIYIYIYTFIII